MAGTGRCIIGCSASVSRWRAGRDGVPRTASHSRTSVKHTERPLPFEPARALRYAIVATSAVNARSCARNIPRSRFVLTLLPKCTRAAGGL